MYTCNLVFINDNTKFIFVSIYSYDKDIDKSPYSDTESEEEFVILDPITGDIYTMMPKRPQKQEHTSQRQTRKKMVNQTY